MIQYYFKASDKNEYGPIGKGEIQAWLQQGRMNQDSLMRAVDSEEWRPLNDYPELLVLLAPSSFNATTVNFPAPGNRNSCCEPHRGALILTFGILSIVCCFPFGIAAWIMGNNDMQQIEAGMMNPSGKGITNAGKICGIVGTIIGILTTGFWILISILEFSMI